MIEIISVQVTEVKQLLEKHNSNIRFNNYDLPKYCPENEFECYKVKLVTKDIERIYLVGNFHNVTNKTGKLKDVNCADVLGQKEEDRGLRVKQLMDGGGDFLKGVNLLEDQGFEIVLLGRDLNKGSLLIIDGSHRAIAHYLTYGTVEGVPAYVCIHKNIIHYMFYKFIATV